MDQILDVLLKSNLVQLIKKKKKKRFQTKRPAVSQAVFQWNQKKIFKV